MFKKNSTSVKISAPLWWRHPWPSSRASCLRAARPTRRASLGQSFQICQDCVSKNLYLKEHRDEQCMEGLCEQGQPWKSGQMIKIQYSSWLSLLEIQTPQFCKRNSITPWQWLRTWHNEQTGSPQQTDHPHQLLNRAPSYSSEIYFACFTFLLWKKVFNYWLFL